MDMPNALYNLLNPPAIVNDLGAIVAGRNTLCRAPNLNKETILGELLFSTKFFGKVNFFYDEKNRYYDFMLDTIGLPIATWIYSVNEQKKPVRLEKIVYFREDDIFVIFYYNHANFSRDGIIDWTNAKKVSCIDVGGDIHKTEVLEALVAYTKNQLIEKLKEEIKKEKGTVI